MMNYAAIEQISKSLLKLVTKQKELEAKLLGLLHSNSNTPSKPFHQNMSDAMKASYARRRQQAANRKRGVSVKVRRVANLVALSLVLLMSTTAFATPLKITDGTFSEGLGGIRYDFSGRLFSAAGTDTIGFAGLLRGIAFAHVDLLSFDLDRRGQSDRWQFTGVLGFSNPGGVFEQLDVRGNGVGLLQTFGPGITHFSMVFGNSAQALIANPEPGTWLLLATGLLGLLWWKRPRKRIPVYQVPWS